MSLFGVPNIRRLGQSAIVLDAGTSDVRVQHRILAVARDARVRRCALEVVPGNGNLTLIFAHREVAYDVVARALASAWDEARDDADAARTIEIPVRYGGADGPDLQAVADRCGLRVEDAIAVHAGAEYVVGFLGFLPGFAYLEGLDRRLHLPRREQPRTRVPAGSVAIAGAQSAVYPFDSPGGWHLIGRTDCAMFVPSRNPAELLSAGDRVRFVVR